MLSLPWGFFCSARSLQDKEAATAFAKLQYFLSLPEPQTRTRGGSLWKYSSRMGFKTCCPTCRGQHNSALIGIMRHDHTSSDHYLLHPCSGIGMLHSAAPASPCPSFTPAKPTGKTAHVRGFYRDREPRIGMI